MLLGRAEMVRRPDVGVPGEFKVHGSGFGFRALGPRFRVQGLGSGLLGLRFRVQGLKAWVAGSGSGLRFRVQGSV